jgi:hypothetical protein
MLTAAQIEGLTARFRAQIDNISVRTSNAVASAWQQLPDYEDHRLPEFARRVQPVTTGSKRAAVALGVAFYSTLATQKPVSVAATAIPLEFDARAAFVAYWNALGNGRAWEEAVQAGQNRAESTADGLIIHSSRLTGDHVLPKAKWTRVTGGNACDFCQEAANGTYSSAEAADFGHERCSCTAIPI